MGKSSDVVEWIFIEASPDMERMEVGVQAREKTSVVCAEKMSNDRGIEYSGMTYRCRLCVERDIASTRNTLLDIH